MPGLATKPDAFKGQFDYVFRFEMPAATVSYLYERKMNSKQKQYATTIAKTLDCTYSEVVRIVQILQKLNLISVERIGRIRYISLTASGVELGRKLFDIKGTIKKLKEGLPSSPTEKGLGVANAGSGRVDTGVGAI